MSLFAKNLFRECCSFSALRMSLKLKDFFPAIIEVDVALLFPWTALRARCINSRFFSISFRF